MSRKELTAYVSEETYRVVESLRDASLKQEDIWDMSMSQAAGELLEHGIDVAGENPDLEELIDEVSLRVYRKQKEQDKLQERGREIEMTGGWRGRVRSRFNARLAGTEPYPPDDMEELAELYWGEIQVWEDDDERLPEHREWLDQLVEDYRDAYRAKQVVPDETFQNVDDVGTGADLLRLRDHFDEVLRDIAKAADGEGFDVEAMYRKLAADYAVEEETVALVVDELTSDDVDARRAMKSGEGIMDKVDHAALASWGGESAPIDEADDGDRDDEPELEGAADRDRDRGPSTTLEDITDEETIETARELLESGLDEREIRLELRGVTRSETEREAAIKAARERTEGLRPAPDEELPAATDGGEQRD